MVRTLLSNCHIDVSNLKISNLTQIASGRPVTVTFYLPAFPQAGVHANIGIKKLVRTTVAVLAFRSILGLFGRSCDGEICQFGPEEYSNRLGRVRLGKLYPGDRITHARIC